VQSETTLVRTESRVELDSETPVDGDSSVIPLPCNSEVDDSLGNLNNLECTSVLGVLDEEWLKGRGDLVDRLTISSCSKSCAGGRLTCSNSGSVGRLDIMTW
jgi:hypothetical protein